MNSKLSPLRADTNDSSWSLVAISLYSLLFFLPMKRFASLGWIGLSWEVSFSKILIVATFILWLLSSLIKKDRNLFSSPFRRLIYIVIILHIAAPILTLFITNNPDAVVEPAMRRIVIAVFLLTTIKIISNSGIFLNSCYALIMGSIPGAIAGIYEATASKPVMNIIELNKETQRVMSDLHVTPTGGVRIQGFSGDANLHAYIYIITIGIALSLLYDNFKVGPKFRSVLLTVLLIMFSLNVFASASRSGWIGMTVLFMVFTFLSKIRRKWIIVSGIITLYLTLFAGVAMFTNTPTLSRVLGLEGERSIIGRTSEIKVNIAMFRSHPILGVGAGNISHVMNRYLKHSPSYPKVAADYIRLSTNGYLILLAEYGLFGITIYLLILYCFIAILVRIIIHGPDDWMKVFAVGLLSNSAAHLFLLIVYPVFDNEMWWLTLGLGLALLNLSETKKKQKLIV